MGVSYLAGGAAARLPVKLRYQVEPYRFTFPGKYTDFTFGDDTEGELQSDTRSVRRGAQLRRLAKLSTPNNLYSNVELDRAGSARLTLSEIAAPKTPGQIPASAQSIAILLEVFSRHRQRFRCCQGNTMSA